MSSKVRSQSTDCGIIMNVQMGISIWSIGGGNTLRSHEKTRNKGTRVGARGGTGNGWVGEGSGSGAHLQ